MARAIEKGWRRRNQLKHLGNGSTTDVWHVNKLGSQKSRTFVLKDFSRVHPLRAEGEQERIIAKRGEGFNEAGRRMLEKNLSLLKKEYGPFIPPTRFIKNSSCRDRYFLAQTFINGEDLFDYFPVDFDSQGEENMKEGILDLVRRIKDNYQRMLEDDKEAILLDLVTDNLKLQRDGRIYMVDSLGLDFDYFRHDPDKELELVLLQTARLELLAGRNSEEVFDDHLYDRMFVGHREKLEQQRAEMREDKNFLYRFLSDIYNCEE